MATINLVRSRWPRCPHEYTIRYRNAAGRQAQEGGFAHQDKAKTRLAEISQERKYNPLRQGRAERIQKYAPMQFRQYVGEWHTSQRSLSPASLRHLDSLLEHHLLPAFASRRTGTFDHKVVDAFLVTTERNGVGLATQANVFDKLRAILLDAHRLGLYDRSPVEGVVPPQYDPKRAVIPSPEQGDDNCHRPCAERK